MARKKTTTALWCISSIIFLLIFQAIPAEAISRGIMAEAIIESLAIPRWTGEEHFSDVPENHPAFPAVETARAYGIIFPGERFHPDLEATRMEALLFAFKAMGWSHEARLINFLVPKNNPQIPEYMIPYLTLGKACTPCAPEVFLSDPLENLNPQDLQELKDWLIQCRRSISWDQTFHGEYASLRVCREKIGTPPSSWAIFIKEFQDKENALSLQKNLSEQGLSAFMANTECAYAVYVGPYTNYVKAWEVLARIPADLAGQVVPYSEQGGNPLFWAAIQIKDEQSPFIVTAHSLGKYILPLSQMNKELKAEGAINGGFFTKGKPIGTLLINGIPLFPSYERRSAVGWTAKGKALFGSGEFRAVLRKNDRIAPIGSLNTFPSQNGLALFSPEAGALPRPLQSDAEAFLLQQGAVKKLNRGDKARRIVPEGHVLLAARGYGIQIVNSLLEHGNPLSIEVQWRDSAMREAIFALQGGPMLLLDGQLQTKNEGFSKGFRERRHPRTLVGTDGKALWWIVVDGRDPWHSNGVTLMEASQLAHNLGLSTVLNLDGGGSSQLLWKGEIVNAIPGGKERPLPYGIFFGSRE